jgi:hypothetical protein
MVGDEFEVQRAKGKVGTAFTVHGSRFTVHDHAAAPVNLGPVFYPALRTSNFALRTSHFQLLTLNFAL